MSNKGTPKQNSSKKPVEKKAQSKVKVEKSLPLKSKPRHKKVIEKVIENGGSLGEAMREVGYSEAYAKNPHKLKNSKSFKALLDFHLPEEQLLMVHGKQLMSWKLNSMIFQKQVDDESIFELMEEVGCVVKKIVEIPQGKLVMFIMPDNQSRNKALEMALKLHKRLTDKVEIRDTTPYAGLSDAELAQKIKQGKQFFTKKTDADVKKKK